MRKYLIKDGRVVPEDELSDGLLAWAKWFEKADRKVASTWFRCNGEEVEVSTVFLGIDHNWGSGPPVLWETMIFGGRHAGYQRRYTSVAEAQKGHEEAVELVKREGFLTLNTQLGGALIIEEPAPTVWERLLAAEASFSEEGST